MALKDELTYLLRLQAQVAAPETVMTVETAAGHLEQGPQLAARAATAAAEAVTGSTAIDVWLDVVIATLDARYAPHE